MRRPLTWPLRRGTSQPPWSGLLLLLFSHPVQHQSVLGVTPVDVVPSVESYVAPLGSALLEVSFWSKGAREAALLVDRACIGHCIINRTASNTVLPFRCRPVVAVIDNFSRW